MFRFCVCVLVFPFLHFLTLYLCVSKKITECDKRPVLLLENEGVTLDGASAVVIFQP